MAIAPPPDHGTPPDPAHPRNGFDRFFEISALYFLRGPIESAVL